MKSFFTIILSVMAATCFSGIIDQQQLLFDASGDISMFGNAGQSFTAGTNGLIKGISLYLKGNEYNQTAMGSDFTISLYAMDADALVGSPLASGSVGRDGNVKADVLDWVTVNFDAPYRQTEGESLAFTILETSGGGALGWNDYAFALNDPYSGGRQFWSHTPGVPLSPLAGDRDLTFQSVVIPEPSSGILLLLSTGGIVWCRRNRKFY